MVRGTKNRSTLIGQVFPLSGNDDHVRTTPKDAVLGHGTVEFPRRGRSLFGEKPPCHCRRHSISAADDELYGLVLVKRLALTDSQWISRDASQFFLPRKGTGAQRLATS
jgi:hypothetical protein